MKREFQKDVSSQMQVWLAAPSSERMHFGQLLLFASEDQHNAQKNHIWNSFFLQRINLL